METESKINNKILVLGILSYTKLLKMYEKYYFKIFVVEYRWYYFKICIK